LRVTILTLFPELIAPFVETSVLGKACERGLVSVELVQIRDFANDRHRTVDDAPYGGGCGMVMKPEPLAAALESVETGPHPPHRIFLTPQGRRFDQRAAVELAEKEHLVLICGRYEGVDERIRKLFVDDEISLGDFVLSGGEVAAAAVVEAVARLVPGVMGNHRSAAEESHTAGTLEYPQYTRPAVFRGLAVPDVLRSGDHDRIRIWRKRQAQARTADRRPDLLEASAERSDTRAREVDTKRTRSGAYTACKQPPESVGGKRARKNLLTERASRAYVALLHHPVYDRNGQVVTTALTNLDLHDIARAARTFGLAGYRVVTPVAKQREMVSRILGHWVDGYGGRANRRRRSALELVASAERLDDVVEEIEKHHGTRPVVAVTTARSIDGRDLVEPEDLFLRPEVARRPVVLAFGTGWGLTREMIERADICLQPIKGPGDYNHLSVRSAVSIYLARLFGRPA
jgi:tRNA (guanine37-N1)-methyltransferase